MRISLARAVAIALLVAIPACHPRSGSVDEAAPPPRAAPPDPDTIREVLARQFTVERIVDGDTFVIIYDGEQTYVRLYGINAPERREPHGPQATQALRDLIGGKVVRIQFPGSRKRDNFGRLLCDVYLGGVNVGGEMIRGGHAQPYHPSATR